MLPHSVRKLAKLLHFWVDCFYLVAVAYRCCFVYLHLDWHSCCICIL